MAQTIRTRSESTLVTSSPPWQHADLVTSVGLALVTAVLVIAFPEWRSPLRTFLGFMVVLLLPGYVFHALLFPKKDDVDGVERVALSLGLSIVVIPFVGLILNYTPWGIRLAPIAVGLALSVTLLGIAAYVRRRTLREGLAFFLDPRLPEVRKGILLFALVAAVVGGVPSLAVALRPNPHDTEFYVLGKNGRLEDYPRTLAPGEQFQLTFGISNRSSASQTYTIRFPFEMKYDHVVVPMLKPGTTWEQPVSLRAPAGNGRTKLAFDLYRSGTPAVYRKLRLFVDIQSPSGTSSPVAPPTAGGATSSRGQGQNVPGATGQSVVLGKGFKSYRVKSGDTMYSIAQRFYGNGNDYPRIVAANLHRLKNFRNLSVGLVLRIPSP